MSKKLSLFLVDDEPSVIFTIKMYFQDFDIISFTEPEEALKNLENKHYDILIVDYKMPKMSGIEFLIESKKRNSFDVHILLTAFADKQILEDSINQDLIDRIIEKPVEMKTLEEILNEEIIKLNGKRQKEAEYQNMVTKYQNMIHENTISEKSVIGLNKGLKKVNEQIKSLSNHPINILITGETGTGKELIARLIHNSTLSANTPFIKINCSALAETLGDDEIFGSENAPTPSRKGKIGLANGGTLFIDEIGDMKPESQEKLLRVIEQMENSKSSKNNTLGLSFKLICSTNKDIKSLVEQKLFREDLYFRINNFPVHIPPLRERKEDIDLLIQHFLDKGCQEMDVKRMGIDKTTLTRLKDYSWPGNVRELENVILRGIILSIGKKNITMDNFEHLFRKGVGRKQYNEAIDTLRDEIIRTKIPTSKIENDVLKNILDYFDDNILIAVEKTGISKNKFYRRIRN